MFASEIREISIVSKHYQVFAMINQIYIYKNWTELFDCVRTATNERGIFSCASFKGDDHRFMIATIGEKTRCGFQIKDYVFRKDMTVDKVFGDGQTSPQHIIGDLAIDDFGEKLLVVNAEGTLLKTYSLFEIRTDQ